MQTLGKTSLEMRRTTVLESKKNVLGTAKLVLDLEKPKHGFGPAVWKTGFGAKLILEKLTDFAHFI